MSLDEEPLSSIPGELFEMYKAPSTNVNLTDTYKNLQIALSQNPLPYHFTTSSSVRMRNEFLDPLRALLVGTQKPVLTPNRCKLWSNKELVAIGRNLTKKGDS